MVHDSIDVERCVWDLEYRDMVRRSFDNHGNGEKSTANQNPNMTGAAKNLPQVHRPS